MPYKDKEKDKEYHKNYLATWKKKNPNKFSGYFKTFRQKHPDKSKENSKKYWASVLAKRPIQTCKFCGLGFKGRLNQDYCSVTCREKNHFVKRRGTPIFKEGVKRRDGRYKKTSKFVLNSLKKREKQKEKDIMSEGWNNLSLEFAERLRKDFTLCPYCRTPLTIEIESFDHFDPKKPFTDYNTLRCCRHCNTSKQDISPDYLPGWIKQKGFDPLPIVWEKIIAHKFNEDKDTTFTNLWLFKKKGPINYNPDNVEILNDHLGKEYGLSQFNPVFSENILNFWSSVGDEVLDPFSGRTRALVTGLKKRKYTGFEVSKIVSEHVNKEIEMYQDRFEHRPVVINKDSYEGMDDLINSGKKFDFVFTCPPYHNLERYESVPGQLSDIALYSEFLNRLKDILLKSYSLLNPGKYMAIVVGDWRENRSLKSFHSDVIQIMKENNVNLHDLIIMQTVSNNFAAVRFGSLKQSKITAKVSEFLLVFKKPEVDLKLKQEEVASADSPPAVYNNSD